MIVSISVDLLFNTTLPKEYSQSVGTINLYRQIEYD